ncbi:hypothetical protein F132_41 [Flavobacterium sp. phage 1/32]|nr:hypothetical protein F132_41 [Flavobacterium sp. phage 1/32]
MGLDSLIKLSEQNRKQMELELAKFDKVFEEVIKGVPEDQKGQIEKVKIISNKAIQLAKEGRQEEANELIKTIQNER